MKFKCFIGFHQWTPWKEVEGSFSGNDPGLWYWHWSETRSCTCCGNVVTRHV